MEFFKLDWGELAKCSLPSLAVILRFNPGDDGEVEFLSRAPVLTIKHVLLQECEEALHGGVVARGSNSTHGPNKQVLLPPVEPSQFTSIRYGERLDEIGARPSIGSIGDAFDNALAESVNALYKTELTRGPGRGPLTISNCKPSGGCTGTTTNVSTAISATSRRSSSRQSTMQPSAKPR